MPTTSKSGELRDQPRAWPVWLRSIVSLLVSLHMLAVFSAPWADPPPSSDLARAMAAQFAPYLQFMSLNNGYRFFAPDPGPSHLIKYEVLGPDGTLADGKFPDRDEQWPRLLYHRHFMISEMIFQMVPRLPDLPPGVPPEQMMSQRELRMFRQQQERARLLQRSMANYLLAQYPRASSVRLTAQTHAIPTPVDLQRGMSLTDDRLYEDRFLGDYPRKKP